MPKGILEEIDAYSKRGMDRLKQEVSDLERRKAELGGIETSYNVKLSSLEKQIKDKTATLKKLEGEEESVIKARKAADDVVVAAQNKTRADLVKESDDLNAKASTLEDEKKDITRREANLVSLKNEIVAKLNSSKDSFVSLISDLNKKLSPDA